jgi:pimeloyl-ACP methyl ester carboxylesterase
MHDPYPHPWYDFEMMRAPGLVRLALEWRAPWEFGATMLAAPWLNQTPDGDGHPVVVFPGLMASDSSTRPLRNFLERKGYRAYGWDKGSNFGPKEGVLDHCMELVLRLRRQHRRKVSLIGWSLGGLYARELANERPELVACVVTLGAPFAGSPRSTAAWRAYERRSGLSSLDERPLPAYRPTPRCPTTSIYSRSDGFVAWPSSIESLLPAHAENVRVRASHLGLGVHPAVWIALADRLAQDPAHWHRFVAPARWRWWFPA